MVHQMGLRWCCGHRVTDALHRFSINKTKPKWLQIKLCKTFTSLLQRKSQLKSPNWHLDLNEKQWCFLCLISCFLLWKPMRLIEITGKTEPLMVISTKKGSNFHSFLQHSYTRRYLISSGDNNLTEENRGLCMFTLSFQVWDSQGWTQEGSHLAAGTWAWECQGSHLLVSALDSKVHCDPWQGLCWCRQALDLTSILLAFTYN